MKHLSVALHLGRLLSLPTNISLERPTRNKQSSLFKKSSITAVISFVTLRPNSLSCTFMRNFFMTDKNVSATKHGRRTLMKIVQQYTFSTLEKCLPPASNFSLLVIESNGVCELCFPLISLLT